MDGWFAFGGDLFYESFMYYLLVYRLVLDKIFRVPRVGELQHPELIWGGLYYICTERNLVLTWLNTYVRLFRWRTT